MAIRVQIRRDTASEWQSSDPVLLAGELGIELDTSKWKIGNGIDPWTTRPYVTQGIRGDTGKAFVYDDFTQPQLDALKQGIMTMAQGELSTLIDNTTLTVNDLVSDVNTVVTTANQTNQAMLTAEQLRESQEADRLVAENTRATFYTGYRDSLDLLQGSKANVADVYKKTETYKKSEVDASLSALTTDVNTQLAEKANKAQETWITPTLLNGWEHDPLNPVRYRKNTIGEVKVRGKCRNGVSGQAVFQAIAGYRPLVVSEYVLSRGGILTAGAYVTTGGSVVISTSGNTNYHHLDQISWNLD